MAKGLRTPLGVAHWAYGVMVCSISVLLFIAIYTFFIIVISICICIYLLNLYYIRYILCRSSFRLAPLRTTSQSQQRLELWK